jgi:hypothetical protein
MIGQDPMALVSNAKLSTQERARYQELLEQADRSISQWAEAVEEIRDRKLYREEFETFAEFCRQKLGKSRGYVCRILAAEDLKKELSDRNSLEMNKNLSPIGDKTGSENLVPMTESQARELAKAPACQRQAIMREATQDGTAKPTARAIKRSVERGLGREATQLQYREKIAKICGTEIIQKLNEGEILTGLNDLKLFAELPRDRMKALKPFVLETATFRQAQDREEEQIPKRKPRNPARTRKALVLLCAHPTNSRRSNESCGSAVGLTLKVRLTGAGRSIRFSLKISWIGTGNLTRTSQGLCG